MLLTQQKKFHARLSKLKAIEKKISHISQIVLYESEMYSIKITLL